MKLGFAMLCACVVSVQGCAYVSAEGTELTKRIANDPQLSFPGMGPLAGSMMDATRMIDASVGKSDLLALTTHAEMLSMSVHPESGVASLDFVRSVKVHLPAQSGLPEVLLADYSSTAKLPADGVIDMRINNGFDHTDYFKELDPLSLRVTIEMAAPADAWSASLELTLALDSSGQVNF